MAVLAAAEDLGASGQDFVTAVCISFEIQNHFSDLPNDAGRSQLHNAVPGVIKPERQGGRIRRRRRDQIIDEET
jgi:hypothetical protein